MKRTRGQRLITCLSQALNVLLFDGSEDESISARAWRESWACPRWKRRQRRIDKIFRGWPWREKGHCFNAHSIDSENARAFLAQMSEPEWERGHSA